MSGSKKHWMKESDRKKLVVKPKSEYKISDESEYLTIKHDMSKGYFITDYRKKRFNELREMFEK